MPITANGYYNSPQMAQAFSQLGRIFAPPSAQDSAAYATANARNQQAQQLAALFDYARNGQGFDQTTFDRMGQASGQWTPAAGYYGVDSTAQTARRGQDITSATSLENNRADNQRQAITSLYGALNPGQVAPALPPEIAAAVGLPGIDERRGVAPILTETQVKGGFLQNLTPTQQQQVALSDVPLEQVVMGDGTGARLVPRGQAWGAVPYNKPGSQAAPQNYLSPDGSQGTARLNEAGVLVDTQTGVPLPQGTRTFSTRAQGSTADIGLSTTANQTAATNQGAQITQALNTLDLYENLIRNNPGSIGLVGLIRGTAQNAAATANDLAASFGKTAPELQGAAEQIRQGLGGVAPEFFDPAIPEAQFLQGTLAYAIARTENPQGEVSRQAFDRALERISGGMLANQQSALANISSYRRVLEAQLAGGQALRDPGAARTDTTFRPPAGAPAPAAPQPLAPTGPRTIETPAGRVTIQRVD